MAKHARARQARHARPPGGRRHVAVLALAALAATGAGFLTGATAPDGLGDYLPMNPSAGALLDRAVAGLTGAPTR